MAERRRRVRGAPLCARIITNLTCACDRVPFSSGNPPPYLRTDSQVYFQSRTPAGRVQTYVFSGELPRQLSRAIPTSSGYTPSCASACDGP